MLYNKLNEGKWFETYQNEPKTIYRYRVDRNIICKTIVLPDTSVSFSLYLQPLFGNVFKFLELRSKIPVLCAFSKTLSINNTSLDEFDDEKLGEDEFETPPGPPGSITQTDILIIYFKTLHSIWVSPTPT